MNSSKPTTAEMLACIPFRGRFIDCNYICRCHLCNGTTRLWYGSADRDRQERMEEGLTGAINCPSCYVRKGATKTLLILRKLGWEESIYALWLMSCGEGIDYNAVDEAIKKENKMEIDASENEARMQWFLDKNRRR